eukprot:Rmarinus@m.28794
MGRARYQCDHCGKNFVDEGRARSRHLNSAAHKANVRNYYEKYKTNWEKLLDSESIKIRKFGLCEDFLVSNRCSLGIHCPRIHVSKAVLRLHGPEETNNTGTGPNEACARVSVPTDAVLSAEQPLYVNQSTHAPEDALPETLSCEQVHSLSHISNLGNSADTALYGRTSRVERRLRRRQKHLEKETWIRRLPEALRRRRAHLPPSLQFVSRDMLRAPPAIDWG